MGQRKYIRGMCSNQKGIFNISIPLNITFSKGHENSLVREFQDTRVHVPQQENVSSTYHFFIINHPRVLNCVGIQDLDATARKWMARWQKLAACKDLSSELHVSTAHQYGQQWSRKLRAHDKQWQKHIHKSWSSQYISRSKASLHVTLAEEPIALQSPWLGTTYIYNEPPTVG